MRQVRSPGWGSPETRSTRSRSRTPFIWITAALLRAVSSPSASGVSKRITLRPPWGRITGSSKSSPTGTSKVVGSPPSTEIVSGAVAASGAAPSSSDPGTPMMKEHPATARRVIRVSMSFWSASAWLV